MLVWSVIQAWSVHLRRLVLFAFSVSPHFSSLPFSPLHPSLSFSLAVHLLGEQTGYLFCSISCSPDFCEYILVVFTGACWEFGYVLLGFFFSFWVLLSFDFFFFFWSGKLSRTSFWRTELVLCVTCGSQTCCVSWHGLKCFQINCRSVQHHKVPHKNQGFCFSSFSSVRRCRCPGLLWRCPKCSDERWRHPPGRVSELPQTPSSPLEAFWEGWQGVRALPRHSSSRFCLHGLP